MSMSDARPFVPRERGRGYQGNQNQQHHTFGDDQAMYDGNSSRGRGRGGRGNPPRGPRGGGRNHFQQDRQYAEEEEVEDPTARKARLESNPAFRLMKDFLSRRYDAANKLLNLSAIGTDSEILTAGMFATDGAQRKFFPALMTVCDGMLETQEAKEAAIDSVTLSGNNLENTHVVYTLVHSFRHIKNLDLSNNKFPTLAALQPWKGRYRNLEHLIVDPFEEMGWEDEITSWFPRLKILNGVQVRPDNTSNTSNANSNSNNSQAPPQSINNNQAPPNLPPQAAGTDAQKEEMILYVQQQTNLKRDFAVQCLEAGQWNIEQAGALFAQSQATLPAEAYN